MIYTKNVSEPWFSLIKFKHKTVEGRLNKGDFAKMAPNDILVFTNSEFGSERKFKTQIISVEKYPSFEKYLSAEKMSKCLPGITGLKNGIAIYRKYFTEQDEKQYGIIALRIKRI